MIILLQWSRGKVILYYVINYLYPLCINRYCCSLCIHLKLYYCCSELIGNICIISLMIIYLDSRSIIFITWLIYFSLEQIENYVICRSAIHGWYIFYSNKWRTDILFVGWVFLVYARKWRIGLKALNNPNSSFHMIIMFKYGYNIWMF